MAVEDPDSSRVGEPDRSNERRSAQRRDDPADYRDPPFTEDHDVTLDVPKLDVEELALEVEDLRAHVSR